MPPLTRRRLLAAALALPALPLVGCGAGEEGPVAPPPPAPGTVEMPKSAPGVLPPEARPPAGKRRRQPQSGTATS